MESPAETSIQKQRILPDGCMEMIFHYGDLYRQYNEDGSCIVQPRCFVFGQITHFLEIEPTGSTAIFAVRFYPEGFIPFATLPLKEMENKALSLNKLFGEEGTHLEELVVSATNTAERIGLVEKFLDHQRVNTQYADQVVKATVGLIMDVKGQYSVDQLSQKLNIHRRQLERKCSRVVGLSPKQLAKIIRLQYVFLALKNNQNTPLTSIAQDGDYYDQAHFIKDFKEFTGISPKQFFPDNLKMAGLFYGDD